MKPLQAAIGLTIGILIAVPLIITGLIAAIFSNEEEPPWV